MTLIADILARVARRCSISAPAAWATATGPAQMELRDDHLVETVDDLHKRIDWPSPIGKVQTISGDGSTNYALNSDFIRLTFGIDAVYESANVRRLALPVGTDNQWKALSDLGNSAGSRWYRVKGYEGVFTIDFYPALETGESISLSYVSTIWSALANTTVKSVFANETDITLMPRRILELGTIWRFREAKGLDFTVAHAQYEAWIATQTNRQRGIHKIAFGSAGRSGTRPVKPDAPDFTPPP